MQANYIYLSLHNNIHQFCLLQRKHSLPNFIQAILFFFKGNSFRLGCLPNGIM